MKYLYAYIKNCIYLIANLFFDGFLFFKHSMVFSQNTFNKIESRIILHYHSIEKGLLHNDVKLRFYQNGVADLIKLLKKDIIVANNKKSQIAAAYLAICRYYELHKNINCDISNFFNQSDYYFFKNLITIDFNSVLFYKRDSFFNSSESSFFDFANSRKSIRNFTGEMIPMNVIEQVIGLASTAPSVCNRQPTRVLYTENKDKIKKIFDLQKGLKGYTESINQIFIIVSDRNYFYKIGERYQMFIDGGLLLMNLLYALHYFKIGACPAHWAVNFTQDLRIRKILNLKKSEKVLCLVPIGIPVNTFKTTLSLRRYQKEILKIIP